jgi:bifunctional non-homologous end joining protein LigD
MALEKYKQKRDFSKTKEPKAKIKDKGNLKKRGVSFVVQEHNATRLHWDFRLEVDGVLVSWAITKEPNETDKRLAVKTEDHPLEYAKFHGTIPKGNYGAGSVKIWDSGKFENIRKNNVSMKESLEQGQVEVNLKGKRLNGNYALIRMKPSENYPGENNWLFFKMKR